MSEASVGNFTLLSDCQSAALVGRDGAIVWYCPPRFDAPAVFASLLDPVGGHWSLRPSQPATAERSYLEETMVLQTIFHTSQGQVAVIDALALEQGARGHAIGQRVPHLLLRRVAGIVGAVEVEMEFVPRLEYALTAPLLVPTATGVIARGGPT